MARPMRIEHAGGWSHVTARGNERRAIYRDNRDREHFCGLLAEMVSRFRLSLHAFVLMDNHYHLIIELSQANLSRAVQWLNVSYSVWFNRRHDRSGHLFQGRFKSMVVQPEVWGLALSRYVHLNPVRLSRLGLGKSERQRSRAGVSVRPEPKMVRERLRQLRRYRWSSYPAYAGFGKCPAWLECAAILKLGGGKGTQSLRNYRRYVEEAVRQGLAGSPWEQLKERVVLGSDEFLSRVRQHVTGSIREQPGRKRLGAASPSLDKIIASVEQMKQERWADFRDRRGDSGRDLVLYLGRRYGGLKLRELAKAAGMRNYSAVSIAVARFERRLRRSKSEQERCQQICRMSNVEM